MVLECGTEAAVVQGQGGGPLRPLENTGSLPALHPPDSHFLPFGIGGRSLPSGILLPVCPLSLQHLQPSFLWLVNSQTCEHHSSEHLLNSPSFSPVCSKAYPLSFPPAPAPQEQSVRPCLSLSSVYPYPCHCAGPGDQSWLSEHL